MPGGVFPESSGSKTADQRLDAATSSLEKGRCLQSWKEIAAHLRRDPRTVQRWEKTEALPVYRHVHATGGSVYAFTSELDSWLAARSNKSDFVSVPILTTPVVTPAPVPAPRSDWRVRWSLAIGVALTSLLAIIGFWKMKESQEPSRTAFVPSPLTSLIGDEVSPSFSQDGKKIVYAWGEGGSHFRIMLKSIGSSDDKPITTDQFSAFSPSLSPDDKEIAFLNPSSLSSNPSIWLLQLGNDRPRQLAATGGDGWPWYRAIAWMPSGKSLISVGRLDDDDGNSLFLYPLNRQPKERITAAPPGFSDYFPSVSPDGSQLVFTRFGRGSAALYRKPLNGKASEEQALYPREFQNSNLLASCWDRDGQAIFIASSVGSSGQIWKGRFSHGVWSPPALIASLPHGLFDIARSKLDELVYSAQVSDNNLWKLSLTAPKLEPRQYGGMVTSTKDEASARYSPDGSKLAFESNRSGAWQIWVGERDGSRAAALTHFNGAVTGSPSWSPDGRTIAFDTRLNGKPEIFTVASSGGEPGQITDGNGPNVVPRWSRDGRWIYFASPGGGKMQIWKIRPNGRERIQVTSQGGFAAEESKDGSLLFYTKQHSILTAVWQKPTRGGPESEAIGRVLDRCFAIGSKGIFFGSAPDAYSPASLNFQTFGSKSTTTVRALGKPILYGLALSPDEQELTYGESDARGSDLQIVRNIR